MFTSSPVGTMTAVPILHVVTSHRQAWKAERLVVVRTGPCLAATENMIVVLPQSVARVGCAPHEAKATVGTGATRPELGTSPAPAF